MYTTSRHEATISVPEYLEGFVDVPTFLEACKACPNYDRVWSCPSYDFDVMKYWNRYKTFRLLATKITFDDACLSKTYTPEEQKNSWIRFFLPRNRNSVMNCCGRKNLIRAVSVFLPEAVILCPQCTKPTGKSCLNPEMMRYSIESLGGNVGLTIEKLLGLSLEWMEEGKLPHHFVLVCGLLLP